MYVVPTQKQRGTKDCRMSRRCAPDPMKRVKGGVKVEVTGKNKSASKKPPT